MLDGVFSSVRIDEIDVAKSAGKGLEPVDGEVYGANFTVRAKYLQNVVLDDVPGKPTNVYSGWARCYRTFLPATFRTGPRATTAAILAWPFGLGLFVFLIIVTVNATTALRPLLRLGTNRFAGLLRRGFLCRWTRRTGCGLALGRATFSSAARRGRRAR